MLKNKSYNSITSTEPIIIGLVIIISSSAGGGA
mgnify:CR=1 FL=1